MSTPSLSVSLEDILMTDSRSELDRLLMQAAGECNYSSQLTVSWSYAHYGRHAEIAEEAGMPELARLFSAVWQIEHRVYDVPAQEAAAAREEIGGEYASAPQHQGEHTGER